MKERFNVAVIGAGIIARQMSETLVGMENAALYAIASREPQRAKAYQAEYGYQKAFGSYEEMLADPDIDLVYIATPHSHHAQQAIMCLEAGKPVLSEKAFAVNAEQAKKVLALSREKNLYVGEAIWPRYMPMRKTICDFLASGRLGKPLSLTASLGYNVFGNGPRLREPSLAGGALLDVGVYTLTFASIVFGDDVKSITASAKMADIGVDASDSLYLEYADGRTATLFDTLVAFTDRKGLIHMEDGCVVIENINNFESMTAWKVEGKTRHIIEHVERPKQITGFEYEVQSAFDAITEGRIESPEMPHSEIIRIMEQMDGIRAQIGLRYPFE